jgi:putative glutamine amidotransferase
MTGPTTEGPLVAVIVKSREAAVLRDVKPYLRWLTRHGGTPGLVSLGEQLPGSTRGILLLGGEDVAPIRYGEANRHCERINEARDAFELELLREALGRDVPLLAVCRGIQVLAVAMGGTLYQDLPIELRAEGVRSAVIHRGPTHTDSTHRATIEPGTRLARLVGRQAILVNSHHHQAVRKVPARARVSARATDGTIEAIESLDHAFVLGIQWHPERWPRASSDAIMEGFLEACGGR